MKLIYQKSFPNTDGRYHESRFLFNGKLHSLVSVLTNLGLSTEPFTEIFTDTNSSILETRIAEFVSEFSGGKLDTPQYALEFLLIPGKPGEWKRYSGKIVTEGAVYTYQGLDQNNASITVTQHKLLEILINR